MKPRNQLFVISILCTGFILIAWYLQVFRMELPCPLCVLQRYAFILIGIFCLLGAFSRRIRLFSILGSLMALVGIYLTGYQLWVIAHPAIQCGRDALEEAVNGFWLAKAIPVLFRAESLCSDVPAPFMMLTPPQWALVWFVIFAIALFRLARRGG
ncbi:MAG: disulfide bond formation protein B [Oxalobacter sp.]